MLREISKEQSRECEKMAEHRDKDEARKVPTESTNGKNKNNFVVNSTLFLKHTTLNSPSVTVYV